MRLYHHKELHKRSSTTHTQCSCLTHALCILNASVFAEEVNYMLNPRKRTPHSSGKSAIGKTCRHAGNRPTPRIRVRENQTKEQYSWRGEENRRCLLGLLRRSPATWRRRNKPVDIYEALGSIFGRDVKEITPDDRNIHKWVIFSGDIALTCTLTYDRIKKITSKAYTSVLDKLWRTGHSK